MSKIKFGTDGWRAIIGDEYTLSNLRRITYGTAQWMLEHGLKSVLIGHDCRFGGRMFLEEVSKIMCNEGIRVYISEGITSTPMISYGVLNHQIDLGIVITASHNPALYNGFKLKSEFGGPTSPSDIAKIEVLIPDVCDYAGKSFKDWFIDGSIQLLPIKEDYIKHIQRNFDLSAIQNNTMIAYDAMYGAGQEVMKELFPTLKAFHCEWNPGFNNTPPEPITKNLKEISQFLESNPGKYIAIANDGDADRLAMLDSYGNVIDSHHILMLLLHYLAGFKKLKGKIVVSFSVTNKLKKLADYYGLETIVTKIGFKYIAEYMVSNDVLVAGEESGGLAIKGHIPERDGIWIGLTILEFIAKTGKSITELIQEIYEITGQFAYDRLDLHLLPEQMIALSNTLNQKRFDTWDQFKVINTETLDGLKYYFEHDAWLMFRLSGTEPVLRIYAQGRDMIEVKAILTAAQKVLNI